MRRSCPLELKALRRRAGTPGACCHHQHDPGDHAELALNWLLVHWPMLSVDVELADALDDRELAAPRRSPIQQKKERTNNVCLLYV